MARSYSRATRVTALPAGSNHLLTWNALADVGANVVTNTLLRASAQDFMLTGAWSQPTPFQLNTAITTTPTNPAGQLHRHYVCSWRDPVQLAGRLECLVVSATQSGISRHERRLGDRQAPPPTPISGSYTDFFGTNPMGFYRIKTVSP